ncbi:hypothetical protein FD725_28335 [Nostoc sp. TCL26-01]|nr:hypothetical protein FD725_28335 [Nostoc sp. TCL26-01]
MTDYRLQVTGNFLSPITYPLSPITYPLSPITYPLSPVTYPLSPKFSFHACNPVFQRNWVFPVV